MVVYFVSCTTHDQFRTEVIAENDYRGHPTNVRGSRNKDLTSDTKGAHKESIMHEAGDLHSGIGIYSSDR